LRGAERGFFLAKPVPGNYFEVGGYFCYWAGMKNLI
jgi:hypothetical protein